MAGKRKDSRLGLGRRGERIASDHLRQAGYEILAANWRCPRGEIDLIARDGETLAFVEVRIRRGKEYGSPEESITPTKQARLIEAAQTYVQENGWEGDWRIDVVAVELGTAGKLLRVSLLRNAVDGG